MRCGLIDEAAHAMTKPVRTQSGTRATMRQATGSGSAQLGKTTTTAPRSSQQSAGSADVVSINSPKLRRSQRSTSVAYAGQSKGGKQSAQQAHILAQDASKTIDDIFAGRGRHTQDVAVTAVTTTSTNTMCKEARVSSRPLK